MDSVTSGVSICNVVSANMPLTSLSVMSDSH